MVHFTFKPLLFAAFFSMIYLEAFQTPSVEEKTITNSRSKQIHIKHIEAEGIGYTDGYSSLDLFLSMSNKQIKTLSFLDIRGHFFNNGDYAANSGLGLRSISDRLDRVFGLNAFYDYRSTDKNHYNQVSLGLEALGKKWDFRTNGYLLFSKKKSSPFDFDFNLDTFLLSAKREYAMSGIDGEIAYHFSKIQSIECYAAIGPYFYASQKSNENTTGGRLRFNSTIYTYLSLEGILSYDHLFKWIGQGAVALNVPFGSRKKLVSNDPSLHERLFQQVQHNEIIVLKNHRKTL